VKGMESVIEMEKEAERRYRELAEKSNNPWLKSIMTLLAEEEARHHNYYKGLEKGVGAGMKDSELISAVKKVFLKIRETKDVSGMGVSEVDLYRRMLEVEKEHMDFYLHRAEEVKDEAERQMLLKIAGEEKRHAGVLQNVVDFVSRPGEWLENAEWYHLEDY
jgi:rubrerythrin